MRCAYLTNQKQPVGMAIVSAPNVRLQSNSTSLALLFLDLDKLLLTQFLSWYCFSLKLLDNILLVRVLVLSSLLLILINILRLIFEDIDFIQLPESML